MISPICPCCGYNVEKEEPIVAGRFSYSPGRGFMVDDERLDVELACHSMIGAVMAAKGRVMRKQALADRHNENLANPGKNIDLWVYHLRRAFAARAVEPPFERVPCIGLRWIGPEVEHASSFT